MRRTNRKEVAMRLVVTEFLTLDGVMQAPGAEDEDRSGGFEHGGWQMPYPDEVFGKAVSEGFAVTDGLLLGRRTYEIFAGYWPTAPEDEYLNGESLAATMNKLPKHVVSTTLTEPLEWQNSKLITGDIPREIAKLKQEPGRSLQVIGSGELVQTLIEHDLVDEYRLMIHPIVLGSGKRLFREGIPKTQLTLVDSRTSEKGTLILSYRPGELPS
jgi:dihydrofolate reductase